METKMDQQNKLKKKINIIYPFVCRFLFYTYSNFNTMSYCGKFSTEFNSLTSARHSMCSS